MEEREVELFGALAATWEAIRGKHAELPAVSLALQLQGIGTGGRGSHGDIVRGTWARTGTGAVEGALWVSMVGVACGGRDVLQSFLHEAGHGLAAVRDVAETSRDGRYHNKAFKQLAGEVGLVARRHPVHGWAQSEIARTTPLRYSDTIRQLDVALVGYVPPALPPKRRNRVCLICRCADPRRLWGSHSTVERGDVLCSLCGNPFRLVDDSAPRDDA